MSRPRKKNQIFLIENIFLFPCLFLSKISLSKPVKLKIKRDYSQNKTATKDDPIFQSYMEEGDVFINSELMAIIMYMPHSVKSFDFIVTKDYDGKL